MNEFMHQHSSFAFGVLFVSTVVSLRLVFGLWLLSKFDGVPRWKKLRWSCLALVPVIGPLFYGAFFNLPGHQQAGLGAQPGMPGAGY